MPTKMLFEWLKKACRIGLICRDNQELSWFYVKYVDVPLNDEVVRDMLSKTEMNMTLESTINATLDRDFTVKKILWIKNIKTNWNIYEYKTSEIHRTPGPVFFQEAR